MESHREVRRVIRMLWALIGLTIVMSLLVNVLMGWGVLNQQDQQTDLDERKAKVVDQKAAIRVYLGRSRNAIINLLNPEYEVLPYEGRLSLNAFHKSVEQMSRTLPENKSKLRRSLQKTTARFSLLLNEVHLWRKENNILVEDINHDTSLNIVRDQITKIRSIIDSAYGRERIHYALQIRKYKKSKPNEAHKLASKIIETYIERSSNAYSHILSDLTDIQRLLEVVAGEIHPDELADTKDNKLKPILVRLKHDFSALKSFDSERKESINNELEALNMSLFGKNYRIDEEHQTIHISPGGFYSLRKNYLLMQYKNKQLQNSLANRSRDFELAWASFLYIEQNRQKGLNQKLGNDLAKAWVWVAFFSVLGVVFLLILVWRVFKAISKQVDMLAYLRRQADTSSETKSNFLASMSHELRTPLNAIIGFSEVMQMKAFGSLGHEKYVEYVNDIQMSGRHLLGIINNILDISSIEADKLEIHEEDFDFSAALDVALHLVMIQVQKADIHVSNTVGSETLMLRADSRLVKQMMINLLSNAIKFTPKAGSIIISKKIDEKGQFVISVKDTGIGMDQEGISTALTPFGMVKNAYDSNYNGTGLGLPLVNKMMELHGGSIEIESKLNHGTEVKLLFPASRVL